MAERERERQLAEREVERQLAERERERERERELAEREREVGAEELLPFLINLFDHHLMLKVYPHYSASILWQIFLC